MDNRRLETRKSTALTVAKRAVRRYARDPSENNAEQVSRAWRQIRELAAAANSIAPPSQRLQN